MKTRLRAPRRGRARRNTEGMSVAVDTPAVRVTYIDKGVGELAVQEVGTPVVVAPEVANAVMRLIVQWAPKLRGFDISIEPRDPSRMLQDIEFAFKTISRSRMVKPAAVSDSGRTKITYRDTGSRRAVQLVWTGVEVPAAVRRGVASSLRKRRDLTGLVLTVDVREFPSTSALLQDLKAGLRAVLDAREVQIAREGRVRSLDLPSLLVSYTARPGGGDMDLEVLDAPDLKLTPQDQVIIEGALKEHGPQLRGYRLLVEPKTTESASYRRDLVAALERISNDVWRESVASRSAPLDAQELAELRALQARLPWRAAKLNIPADDKAAADVARPALERLREAAARLDAQLSEIASAPRTKETPEERAARHAREREEADQAERRALREEREREKAATRARVAEVAEYTEDTRTGPRAKMPPALEIDRMVEGPGAGFTVRDDAPRLDRNRLCGNPIDGKAYYFIVTRQTRSLSAYVSREEVQALAEQKGVKPAFWTRKFPLTQSADRDALVQDALRAGPPRRAGEASTWPQLDSRERDLLAAQAFVFTRGAPVPRGAKITLTREEAAGGLQVILAFPTLEYLTALREFVTNTLVAESKDFYLSTEAPTHIGRERTTAKARRGLKPAGGILRPKGDEVRSSVYDRASMLAETAPPRVPEEVQDGGVWDPVARVWTYPDDQLVEAEEEAATAEKALRESKNAYAELVRREIADPQSVTPREAEAAKQAFDEAEKVVALARERVADLRKKARRTKSDVEKFAPTRRSARWGARAAERTSDDFIALEKMSQPQPGSNRPPMRARAPRKARTATSLGDITHAYAFFDPGTGHYRFLRRSTKAATALAQMEDLKPFKRRDFIALSSGPVAEVLAQASRGVVNITVAQILTTSGCVRVNDAIVASPEQEVAAGSKLSIQCEPKNGSEFFGWVPTMLPRDGHTPCPSPEERGDIIKAALRSPQNYSVFFTYNPVLFEATRQLWATRRTRTRAPWETVLGQPRLLLDIDAVGRFGVAANLVQQLATQYASEQYTTILSKVFAPVLGGSLTRALMAGTNTPSLLFVQLWPLGSTFPQAKQSLEGFVSNPLAWTRQVKLNEVDRAVPRLMRLAQVGLPHRKAWRLKTSSPRDELWTGLHLAMKGEAPAGRRRSGEDEELLRLFQSNPPRFASRGSGGLMETVVPSALPATGEFDAPTVALLNRILNAPKPLPKGARPIPDNLSLEGTTLARIPGVTGLPSTEEQQAMMRLLRHQIAEIDHAIASLGPPPYRMEEALARGGALDIQRPGRKRKLGTGQSDA